MKGFNPPVKQVYSATGILWHSTVEATSYTYFREFLEQIFADSSRTYLTFLRKVCHSNSESSDTNQFWKYPWVTDDHINPQDSVRSQAIGSKVLLIEPNSMYFEKDALSLIPTGGQICISLGYVLNGVCVLVSWLDCRYCANVTEGISMETWMWDGSRPRIDHINIWCRSG